MNDSYPITFNSKVPRELKMCIDMIVEVFLLFDEVKWSKNSHYEIGFYHKNKQRKTEYFFGIWYDLWEHYGLPLSIVLNNKGKAPNEWHAKIKKYMLQNYTQGIQVKNYDDYTCILFEYSYFKFDSGDDINNLSEIFEKITEYADSIAIG